MPVNCENSGAKCLPATFEERRQIANLNEGSYCTILCGITERDTKIAREEKRVLVVVVVVVVVSPYNIIQ